MKVSLIAAIAANSVIGRDNDLPWKLRDDMQFFVRTTRGHTVIMGRLNYDSMGKPLPGRRNIVVTRNATLELSGCDVETTIEGALRLAEAGGESEAFVIGGAQIYALAYPYCHVFYRTRVLANVPGDVVFPALDWSDFDVREIASHERDEKNEHPFVIEELTRRSAPRSYREGA